MIAGEAGPTRALVRLLRADSELYRPVGAGFLISSHHVLTCAHVVNDALGLSQQAVDKPAAQVCLDMPLLPGARPAAGSVRVWYPVRDRGAPDELEDIAVLELESVPALPDGARPASMRTLPSDAFFGRTVWMCGFPAGMDDGDWVEGRCLGRNARGWVQITFAPGRQRTVAPGFSGTPVWEQPHHAVIGMIVSTNVRRDEISAAMIPSATLLKAWENLKVLSMPPNPRKVHYSGKTKLAVCRRLGDNWRDLATYFDIPAYEQARFERGDECYALLRWLENRRRLGELPQALASIGREDLAQLLTTEG